MMSKKTEIQEKKNKEVVNKPIEKFTIFPITVSVWENDDIKSFTISKAYKDNDGEWNNTSSFSEADLCVISKILSQI